MYHSWRENNWIHTFPKGISIRWNANSLIHDLNLGHRVHLLWQLSLHHEKGSVIADDLSSTRLDKIHLDKLYAIYSKHLALGQEQELSILQIQIDKLKFIEMALPFNNTGMSLYWEKFFFFFI